MRNKTKVQTLHHVVPSSRRDEGYETDSRENFKLLRKNYHQNWHTLFSNKTPDEVIMAVLMVQHNVINRKVRAVLEAIIKLPKHDFYVPEVLDYYADDEFGEYQVRALREDVHQKILELLWDLDIDIKKI